MGNAEVPPMGDPQLAVAEVWISVESTPNTGANQWSRVAVLATVTRPVASVGTLGRLATALPVLLLRVANCWAVAAGASHPPRAQSWAIARAAASAPV